MNIITRHSLRACLLQAKLFLAIIVLTVHEVSTPRAICVLTDLI